MNTYITANVTIHRLSAITFFVCIFKVQDAPEPEFVACLSLDIFKTKLLSVNLPYFLKILCVFFISRNFNKNPFWR